MSVEVVWNYIFLLYFKLLLVQKTRVTSSTNHMQTKNQLQLGRPHFPAL